MAFNSWVPVCPFIPIHVYLPCIACQFYSITVLIYGIFTWKRRVNNLFSALVLKPACDITLLLITCSGSCSLELTTKRSSWLLQNTSHLFFQEICKVCGGLPKPRGAGLTFTWVCILLLLFLCSSDTSLHSVQAVLDVRVNRYWYISLARKEFNKPDPSLALCVLMKPGDPLLWVILFFFFFNKRVDPT